MHKRNNNSRSAHGFCSFLFQRNREKKKKKKPQSQIVYLSSIPSFKIQMHNKNLRVHKKG